MYNKPKNRSNIASSILLNGDVLEQVKEAAENDYVGSAQQELDKYLDSIEGKIAQFQNRLQELAATTVDSSWIKTIIDLGTGAIEVINKLSKSFGGLNAIIGSVAGAALQFKGLGLFSYNRKDGMKINQEITNFFKPNEVVITDSVKKIFAQIEESQRLAKQKGISVPWKEFIANTKLANESVADFLKNAKYQEKTLDNYEKYVQEASDATSGFGRALSGLKAVGVNVLSTIGNAALSMLASFVVSKAVEGIIYLFTWQDKLIKKGKEAQQAIKDTYDEIKKGQESIRTLKTDIGIETTGTTTVKEDLEQIAEEYTKLRSGVSNVTNENLTLSTDDYEHYLEISNKLAEQYPSLIKNHDKNGNAILGVSSASKECANQLKEVYDNALLVANVDIGKNLSNAFEGLKQELNKYESDYERINQQIALIGGQKDQVEQAMNGDFMVSDHEITFGGGYEEYDKAITNAIKSLGDDVQASFYRTIDTEGNLHLEIMYDDGDFSIDSFVSSLQEKLNAELEKTYSNLSSEQSNLDLELSQNEQYRKDQERLISELTKNYIQTRQSFSDMNQELQSAVISNFKIDFDKLYDKEGDYKGDWEYYLYKEIITPLSQVNEEAQEELAKIFTLDSSSLSLDSYIEQINTILKEAAEKGGVDVEFLKGILPIDELTKEAMEQKEYLKGIFTGEEDQALIDSLSIPELSSAAEYVKQRGSKLDEALQTIIDNFRQHKKEIVNDTTFASLFSDDSDQGIKKTIDNFQALNTEIQGYIDSIKNGESVNIADIVAAHPEELMAYSDSIDHLLEGLLKMQGDEAEKFAENYSELVKKGLGKEPSAEEIELASQYFSNIISEVKIDDANVEEIIRKIRNSIIDLFQGQDPGGQISQYADNIVSQLQALIDADSTGKTGEIIARLSLETDSATWNFETWKEKIEQMRIALKPTWDEQQLANLEARLTGLNSDKTAVTNRITNAQNRGQSANASDYQELINYNKRIQNINDALINRYNRSFAKLDKTTTEGINKANEYKDKINQLTQEQQTLNDETLQYVEMLNGGIELEGLNRQLDVLKQTQTQLELYRDQKSANKEFYSKNDLQDLRNNAEQQISIIEQQNEKLRQQRSIVGGNVTEYNRINNQLIENMKTIQELSATVESYDKSLSRQYSLQAEGILQGVNAVVNQSLTDSVDEDSMEALISAFSELKQISSNIDLSSMFYRSAQGIKVNFRELERYINLQRKISSTGILAQMSKLNAQLRTQQNIYKTLSKQVDIDGTTKRNAAKQNLQNIRSEIKAIGLEVQAYAKAQNAIEESMSGFSKWQAALQTPNAGDKYNTIYSEMPNLEKLANAGLIGTDDFKTAIEMLTQEKRNTLSAYMDIYPWLTEYFRPDGKGLLNLVEDLGWTELGDDNRGVFTINETDVKEISRVLGEIHGGSFNAPAEEVVMAMLDALKDYGFNVVYAMNEVDAQAQKIETVQELAQQLVRQAHDEITGASITTLTEHQEELDALISRYNTLENFAQEFADEPILSRESFDEDVLGIQKLLDYANSNFTDPQLSTYFYDPAKKMADRLGMEIVENADGTFSLIQASYEDTLEKIEEATAQKLQDLRNRPKLSVEDLANAGYAVQIDDSNVDDLVTLYSHTFPSEDGQAAVTLTPILPNGEILSYEALEEYANQLLAGGRDTKGLLLGMYTNIQDDGLGKSALQKADDFAEVLHRVSDVYEHMDEEDEQLLNSLRDYSAEFLKTIDMTKDYSLLPDVSQDAKDAQAAIIAIGDRLGYSKERAMELGTAIIDSFDKFGFTANNFDAEFVVKTRLEEDISDDPDKIDFWKDLISKSDDEALAKEFNLDINTYDGEQKLEDLKQYISGLDSSEFSMTVKLDQGQVDELLESLNNISIKVGVDKDAFTNSAQEAVDQAADKISLSKLTEKWAREGISQEAIDTRLDTIRNRPTFSDQFNDDITPSENQKVTVTFTVDEQMSSQNINKTLSDLQEYAKKNGIDVDIIAKNGDALHKIDDVYDYKNGDEISIIIKGEKDPSFDDVVSKAEKSTNVIKGEHKYVVVGDGSGLDALNTKIDDTQENVQEDGEFNGANTDDAEANLNALNDTIDETQANAEEETETNINTDESMEKLNSLENKQNTIKESANEGSVFSVTITGDDVNQLSSVVNEISQNKNIDIIINGVATTAEDAIKYINENNGKEIEFTLIANDEEAESVLNTFCEETVPGKFQEVKVGGNIDPLNATVKGGVQQIEAAPPALQAVDANWDPFNDSMNLKQNDMILNPLTQPVQMQIYEEPIGPMPSHQLPSQAQSAYDNSLRNSIVYYKAHGTLNAYAKGTDVKNGRLTKDEDALVNEVGQESRITSDGRWELLPHGMHVEHLKRGEIILNHKQTEDLIKHKSAHGIGRIVGGQSAFASGTVYNGMPSHAMATATGSFHFMPDGFFHFFQDLENGVDDLDDYNDSARDAGDAARDVGDAADNVGDAFDDLVDEIQYSFQTIDLVQRRLQYFSNQTKKIADRITEYVDTTLKKELLGKEINAISQELYANSKAATTYTDEAIKEAFDHKYYATDKNAEKSLQYAIADYQNAMNAMGNDRDNDYYKWLQSEVNNLQHQLKVVQSTQLEYSVALAQEINLEDLRNGDFRIDQIDTSTDHGKALYEAAQQYMQLTDNAINAANQIQTLSNQLRSLYSDMINLPFEDLEKSISKLENTMSRINSFMSTMDNSATGIEKLRETLTGIFGEKQAKKLLKTYRTTYDTLNYQIEMTLHNLSAQVNENNAAYQQSKLNYSDLKGQSKSANKRLNSAKKALSGLMLPSYAQEQIQNGEFLDASRFGTYADKIATYNQALAEANALTSATTEAQEKMNEQLEKASQSAAEYAKALVQSVFDKMDNIDKFYKSLTDWQSTLASSLQTNRDYLIKTGSYLKNASQIANSYSQEMNRYKVQADQLRAEEMRLREELSTAMANGRISYGTEDYRRAMTQIINVQNEYVEARSKVHDLNEEFVNIPVKEAEEKLNQIAKKYQTLTQIGNNIDTRGQQRMYAQLAFNAAKSNYKTSAETYGTKKSQNLKEAFDNARRDYNAYNKGPTYKGANAYLEADLERMKEETKVSNETIVKLNAEMDRAQKNYDSYQKTVDEYAMKYMGVLTMSTDSELSKMGWDAITNRTKIDTSNLRGDTNSWVYSYINQWNAYIENLETKAGELKAVQNSLDQEVENNQQKLGELAQALATLYPQEFQNAGEYYRSLYENNEKLASTYEKVRETINELGRSMDQHGNLITDTATLSRNYQNQIDNIDKSYDNMKKSMQVQSQLLANIGEALGTDSEEYRTAQNELYELQNRMNDTIITMDKLRDESREVLYFKPIEEYINKVNKLRDNLDELVNMFSEDMYFTDDGEYTQFGLATAEAAMSGYTRSLQALNKYQEEFYINEERYMNDSSYSAEEYLEKKEQITDATRKELQDANGYRTKIISIYTSRYKQEISYLQEVIKARQEALQKQKEMYDYDRQLKTKTKDIQLIQQQIRALENLTDMESKAQKARLEARLAESQEDLDETVKQHVYDMRIEGLSNLSEELNENYDKIVKDLKINTDTVVSTINDLSTGLEGYLDITNAGIDTWLKTFSPTLNQALVGIETLESKNTTAIPNKDQLETAADRMIHYYDNLSATEAEKIGTITDAVKTETQKIADAVSTYTANKTAMENGANAMVTIKDGFSAITNGIPQQTSNAIATNIDRVIAAIQAKDVTIQTQTASNQASTSYINPVTSSANIINSAARSSGAMNGDKYDFFSSSSRNEGTSSSSNVIIFPSSNTNSDIILSGSSSFSNTSNTKTSSSGNTSANDLLSKMTKLVLQKFKSVLGYGKVAQAEDDFVNKRSFSAIGGTSNEKALIDEWNKNKSRYTSSQIKKQINNMLDQAYSKGNLGNAKYKRYAKGTLSALPGLAQIFEEGPEIITTKRGTFMPFSGGEGVIPADITKGLMNLGVAAKSGKIDKKLDEITSIFNDGFDIVENKVDELIVPIRQIQIEIDDNNNELIDHLMLFNDYSQEAIEQAKQIPMEVNQVNNKVEEAIDAYKELQDAFQKELDNMRSAVPEENKPSAYVKTSYGTLKPIESNIELFSSDKEYDDIMKANLELFRSCQEEIEAVSSTINNYATSSVSIDSLITVNGNVDESVVDRIQQVATDLAKNRKFLNNIVNYVSAEQAKDLRKSGRAR